jgi:uncharacterized protein (TIGR02118 family)
MIVAVSLIRKREDLSVEAFRKHWLDPHGVITARLPGTRSYVQGHVVDHLAMNEAARAADIQGFAVLAFDSIEQRDLAYSSPVIRACNIDSEQFIGAVRRLVTEPIVRMSPPGGMGAAKVYLLRLDSGSAGSAVDALAGVGGLEGLCGHVDHRILSQAPPPESRIPDLGISVANFSELWFEDEAALGRHAEALAGDGRTGVFVAEEHRLI